MPGFSSRKRVEENEEVEEVGEKNERPKKQIFMDFDMTSRKKVYFCRRLRHKKELYALVPLHRNLENFKAKNHKWNKTIKLAPIGASTSFLFVEVFQSLMQLGR